MRSKGVLNLVRRGRGRRRRRRRRHHGWHRLGAPAWGAGGVARRSGRDSSCDRGKSPVLTTALGRRAPARAATRPRQTAPSVPGTWRASRPCGTCSGGPRPSTRTSRRGMWHSYCRPHRRRVSSCGPSKVNLTSFFPRKSMRDAVFSSVCLMRGITQKREHFQGCNAKKGPSCLEGVHPSTRLGRPTACILAGQVVHRRRPVL